jgi:hypothetical protein
LGISYELALGELYWQSQGLSAKSIVRENRKESKPNGRPIDSSAKSARMGVVMPKNKNPMSDTMPEHSFDLNKTERDQSQALHNAERLLFLTAIGQEDWDRANEFGHSGELVLSVYQKCLSERRVILAERIRQRFGQWFEPSEKK